MNLQEFSILRSYCEKIKEDNELTKMSDAFYYLVLESILDISENEIVESITDNSFLTARHEEGGHTHFILPRCMPMFSQEHTVSSIC